jgi:site-specific DNA-methyltransferase (adenine-specific)
MRELAGGRQMKSVWQIPAPDRDEKRFGKHPTQKPVALLERILLAASNEGDLVLDPFMGSGTALIAAQRCGRRAVGIEIEQKYVEIAINRLAKDTERKGRGRRNEMGSTRLLFEEVDLQAVPGLER